MYLSPHIFSQSTLFSKIQGPLLLHRKSSWLLPFSSSLISPVAQTKPSVCHKWPALMLQLLAWTRWLHPQLVNSGWPWGLRRTYACTFAAAARPHFFLACKTECTVHFSVVHTQASEWEHCPGPTFSCQFNWQLLRQNTQPQIQKLPFWIAVKKGTTETMRLWSFDHVVSSYIIFDWEAGKAVGWGRCCDWHCTWRVVPAGIQVENGGGGGSGWQQVRQLRQHNYQRVFHFRTSVFVCRENWPLLSSGHGSLD